MKGRPPLTNWSLLPLGAVPDRVIAESVGCAIVTVRQQRKKRGIAGCSKRGRPRKVAA